METFQKNKVLYSPKTSEYTSRKPLQDREEKKKVIKSYM